MANNEGGNQTDFMDGNQLIQMTVDADEDQFQTDYESDMEQDSSAQCSPVVDDEDQVNDRELFSNEDQGGAVAAPEPGMSGSNLTRENAIAQTQSKIQQLDAEMHNRMLELHQMMSKQGLHGSAEVLQSCLQLNEGKDVVQHANQLNKSSCGVIGGNVNQNATQGLIRQAQSIETIYKNAVQKCTSSLSEEAMEISDQSLSPTNDALASSGG